MALKNAIGPPFRLNAPFPECVELKGVAAQPGAVRKHIACHAVLGHVPNGEQKRETMQYCIICGYTIKQCTLRKQIGKFSGRPVVKCGTGKPFGSWSKKLTANAKNTVSVNHCTSCTDWVFNFNLKNHYAEKHAGDTVCAKDKAVMKEISKEHAREVLQKLTAQKKATRLLHAKILQQVNVNWSAPTPS